MQTIRIIPRLDIKGPNLVKGIHLEGLRVLGRPETFAKYYYENGADELIYQDVVASLYDRNSLEEIISATASQIFIPLTVGGGIRTLSDIKRVLRAGADKVAINTAAINDPEFVSRAAREFGSSTIVIAIEAIKQADGKYLAFTDNGREYTGLDAIEWAKRVQELGAGEILLTSVDREGTGLGFDLELIQKASSEIDVPLIVHGGAGNIEHIESILKSDLANSLAIASVFHYHAIQSIESNMSDRTEGNVDFLMSKRKVQKISPVDLNHLKQYLHEREFICR
jgi:imidazole glycerol-phosphate synthase subunit HisF